jgi:hypothetical protein
MLTAAALCTLGVWVADARALGRARAVVAQGLAVHEPQEAGAGPLDPPRFDLGLGNDILARVARGAAAYRHRERTVALVKGTPSLALAALQRALRRTKIGLVLIAGAGALHVYANSDAALTTYLVLRCGPYDRMACTYAADRVEASDPPTARLLRRRGRPWTDDLAQP